MICAVVGGQYGSEAKGNVVGHIAKDYGIHVRVGAANAGHTVYTEGQGTEPEKHVMQQLPCAAYANPGAKLVLGPGAMISQEILDHEIGLNRQWRRRNGHPDLQLFIDQHAHVVTDEHIEIEQATDLAERIGSTSTIAKEGIGAAQAARVMRTGYMRAGDVGYATYDTTELLEQAQAFDGHILLEGTQGTGLSNITGQYPYVTSRNTTAAGLAGDAGVGPRDLDRVIMVCRTFPIRVAGPSGPFYSGSQEIDWAMVGIDPERERTTVTKKIRRVATFSYEQVIRNARLNSATEIALMFADYLDPGVAGGTGQISARDLDGTDRVGALCRGIEKVTGVPVTYVGTGPATILDRVSDLHDTL